MARSCTGDVFICSTTRLGDLADRTRDLLQDRDLGLVHALDLVLGADQGRVPILGHDPERILVLDHVLAHRLGHAVVLIQEIDGQGSHAPRHAPNLGHIRDCDPSPSPGPSPGPSPDRSPDPSPGPSPGPNPGPNHSRAPSQRKNRNQGHVRGVTAASLLLPLRTSRAVGLGLAPQT